MMSDRGNDHNFFLPMGVSRKRYFYHRSICYFQTKLILRFSHHLYKDSCSREYSRGKEEIIGCKILRIELDAKEEVKEVEVNVKEAEKEDVGTGVQDEAEKPWFSLLPGNWKFLVADTRLYTLPCRSVGR